MAEFCKKIFLNIKSSVIFQIATAIMSICCCDFSENFSVAEKHKTKIITWERKGKGRGEVCDLI